MRKTGLILIILSLFMTGIDVAFADIPLVINLDITDTTDGRALSITVRHNSPSNSHYVSELEVKVGEEIMTIELDSQSGAVFTEETRIDSTGDVQVRAYCTIHGWSGWMAPGEEPEPSGGILGYPLLSVLGGLATVLYLNNRRH
jgi:desulfoferrodoxin (superoxide reductase-like protein)